MLSQPRRKHGYAAGLWCKRTVRLSLGWMPNDVTVPPDIVFLRLLIDVLVEVFDDSPLAVSCAGGCRRRIVHSGSTRVRVALP